MVLLTEYFKGHHYPDVKKMKNIPQLTTYISYHTIFYLSSTNFLNKVGVGQYLCYPSTCLRFHLLNSIFHNSTTLTYSCQVYLRGIEPPRFLRHLILSQACLPRFQHRYIFYLLLLLSVVRRTRTFNLLWSNPSQEFVYATSTITTVYSFLTTFY